MTYDIKTDEKVETSNTTEQTKQKLKLKKSRRKPYEWLNDLERPVRGEKSLWVAVITQALMDALSQAKNAEAQYHKHEAINWLTGGSKDFLTVCHFAGLDPSYVRRKAKRALLAPCPWRAEAGKGRRYEERRAYRKRLKEEKARSVQEPPKPDIHTVIVGPWH